MADEAKTESNGEKHKLTGVEETAVFLMSIGEAEAAEIMRLMGPKEVQTIGEAMSDVANIDKQTAIEVLKQFNTSIGGHTALGMGSEDYLKSVLNKALGSEKAGGMLDKILLGKQSKGLEALRWMEPKAVAEIIHLEHPQIIAIVLSYLEADQAAQVMLNLPSNTRENIMLRIASLDGIQPAALFELDEILEKQFSSSEGNLHKSSVGGAKVAANMLNFMGEQGTSILEAISSEDEDLGQSIQDKMFVFDNLMDVGDRDIQRLMREIAQDQLLIALKGADEGVKDKILKNMSSRAADMLRDDLEAAQPMKISDVEAAQRDILNTARRLADAGEISLGGGGEELV